MRSLVVAILLVALGGAAGARKPAAAAPAKNDPALADAKRHFDQAVALFNDGDFGGALAEFEASYKIRRVGGRALQHRAHAEVALSVTTRRSLPCASISSTRRRFRRTSGPRSRSSSPRSRRCSPRSRSRCSRRARWVTLDGRQLGAGADARQLRRRRGHAHVRVRGRRLQAGQAGAQGRRRAAADADGEPHEDSDDGQGARGGEAAARRSDHRRPAARAGAGQARAAARRAHARGAAGGLHELSGRAGGDGGAEPRGADRAVQADPGQARPLVREVVLWVPVTAVVAGAVATGVGISQSQPSPITGTLPTGASRVQ